MGQHEPAEQPAVVQEGDVIMPDRGLFIPPTPVVRDAAPQSGLIEFLDNRWRFAETSDANAKRALLLLAGALVSIALTLGLLLTLLTGVGMLLAALAGHLPPAVLALVPLLGGGDRGGGGERLPAEAVRHGTLSTVEGRST
ncbi:hypothetical protein J2S43_003896 [Catenuloplanes nepalensis]|uniref:Uncharacterized protein n=1 Tax=Catenuloplanes nepalensis TaxID=587533 RepID=A0ABT9MVB1_9ACTN|nr:hypothetical protein [Catenuloplanes nepalensis]MDP9795384.1 hypothetical protein [Catenuloplanes nepalensis]